MRKLKKRLAKKASAALLLLLLASPSCNNNYVFQNDEFWVDQPTTPKAEADQALIDTIASRLDLPANAARYMLECGNAENIICKRVWVTTYHATPEQTDSSPDITACNDTIDLRNASKHRYIALSRNLYWGKSPALSCGDKVLLHFGNLSDPFGWATDTYIVSDKMNKRFGAGVVYQKNKAHKVAGRVDVLRSVNDKMPHGVAAICKCKN